MTLTWSNTPVGELCSMRAGGTPPRKEPSYFGGGIPWVKISDMLQGNINETEETISHYGLENSAAKLLPAGTVLLSIFATIGRTAILDVPAATNQAIVGLTPSTTGVDVAYLRRFLDYASPGLASQGRGVAQANINSSILKQLPVPLPHKNGKPDLDEQKRIAAILDKADAIRRKRQQALRLTDDFLRSVFLDMFGDPVTNPKGWDKLEFGELVESTKLGMVRSSKEFGWDLPVPYVRMDALSNDGAFIPEKVQGTDATEADIEKHGLEPGDFLFNTRNSKELVGKVAVYPGPSGATYNNNLMRIRFKKAADPYFICQQFQFARIRRELEARKQGTTSVFAVYWKNLQTLPILCPPPRLQRDFRAIVDKIVSARAPMNKEAAEAEDLFASLQQRAFRGEA